MIEKKHDKRREGEKKVQEGPRRKSISHKENNKSKNSKYE